MCATHCSGTSCCRRLRSGLSDGIGFTIATTFQQRLPAFSLVVVVHMETFEAAFSRAARRRRCVPDVALGACLSFRAHAGDILRRARPLKRSEAVQWVCQPGRTAAGRSGARGWALRGPWATGRVSAVGSKSAFKKSSQVKEERNQAWRDLPGPGPYLVTDRTLTGTQS